MTREDYERYVEAFNARDYDIVFDFYAENPRLAFFGIEITTREQLREFYTFLHRYVRETMTVVSVPTDLPKYTSRVTPVSTRSGRTAPSPIASRWR